MAMEQQSPLFPCSPFLIFINPTVDEGGLSQWGKGRRILPNQEAREEQKVIFFGMWTHPAGHAHRCAAHLRQHDKRSSAVGEITRSQKQSEGQLS